MRLRAFYAVEAILHVLVPAADGANLLDRTVVTGPSAVRLPRSREGLNSVVEICAATHRRLIVVKGSIQLGRQNAADVIRVDTIKSTLSMLDLCRNAAETLRPMLLGNIKGMPKMGSLFGEALLLANVQVEGCTDFMRTLLTITLHNPVQPWKTTTDSQG